MKNAEIISEGNNHIAIELGKIDELIDYSYMHPKRNQEVRGKVFLGEILKSSCAEISFTVIPPHTSMPFMHQHKMHEEVYIFLKGSGQFQVDHSVFDVSEGSVIRISPEGKRIYRNNSDNYLTFICIQNHINSIKNYNVEDGYLAEGEILLK